MLKCLILSLLTLAHIRSFYNILFFLFAVYLLTGTDSLKMEYSGDSVTGSTFDGNIQSFELLSFISSFHFHSPGVPDYFQLITNVPIILLTTKLYSKWGHWKGFNKIPQVPSTLLIPTSSTLSDSTPPLNVHPLLSEDLNSVRTSAHTLSIFPYLVRIFSSRHCTTIELKNYVFPLPY